jgi:hypothetical protein
MKKPLVPKWNGLPRNAGPPKPNWSRRILGQARAVILVFCVSPYQRPYCRQGPIFSRGIPLDSWTFGKLAKYRGFSYAAAPKREHRSSHRHEEAAHTDVEWTPHEGRSAETELTRGESLAKPRWTEQPAAWPYHHRLQGDRRRLRFAAVEDAKVGPGVAFTWMKLREIGVPYP